MSDNCNRPDLSTFLIHLTKGSDEETAFNNLKSIIRGKTLLKSYYTVDDKKVVCFTETPIGCIKTAEGLTSYTNYHKYSRFGIMVYKKDVYQQGGRPVLYLEAKYLSKLPKEIRWRHQKFEPSFTSVKHDYTWEREWRMVGDFKFEGIYYEAIVPSIAKRLKTELDDEHIRIYEDCQNKNIEDLGFDELCDTSRELETIENCLPPEEFDKKVICIDGTCD